MILPCILQLWTNWFVLPSFHINDALKSYMYNGKYIYMTRFDYKLVCSPFATTHYIAAYKTIYMYYLKKLHNSLNKSCDKSTCKWSYKLPHNRLYYSHTLIYKIILVVNTGYGFRAKPAFFFRQQYQLNLRNLFTDFNCGLLDCSAEIYFDLQLLQHPVVPLIIFLLHC